MSKSEDSVKNYTSNGLSIPFNERYFEKLVPADVTDIPDMIRQYNELGYLYLPAFLEKEWVLAIRTSYMQMFDPKIFKEGTDIKDGIFSGTFQFAPGEHGHKNHPASVFVKSAPFLEFTNQKKLFDIAEVLLGAKTIQLKRVPIRHFYKGTHVSSKAHCDYTYLNDGTASLLSIWIPLGDITMNCGGLMYLKGSNNIDLEVLRAEVKSNTEQPTDDRPIAKDLKQVSDITGLPWLYSEFTAGDIVIHNPFVVHATLDCESDMMRLSTDLRFAKANEPIDPRWLDSWRGDDGY